MKNLIEIPLGLPGRVFRSPLPFGRYDIELSAFGEMSQLDIKTIVMLISTAEACEKSGRDLLLLYSEAGFNLIQMPITDFSVPDITKLSETVDQVHTLISAGNSVAVHCNAGWGRTGMFLACLAKKVLRLKGAEAIAYVRKFVPEAVETAEQEHMVELF